MRILAAFIACNSRSYLPSKSFINNWSIRIHIKIICWLRVFERFRKCWINFHLLLKYIWKMEEKLLCIMLFIWIKFTFKTWGKLFYILNFTILIYKLLYKFINCIMKGFFLIVLTLNILFFVKVIIHLLNGYEALHYSNHIT